MNDMLYKTILERKSELRLNSRELSEMAGVSMPTIQKLENGDDISLASLRNICFAMDLILTVIDRSEVAKKEREEVLKKIEMKRKELEELEREEKALMELINK